MVVTNNSTRLTIAVQKSGRLSTASLTLLEACGFRFSLHEAKLLAHCQNQPVDLLRVRDDDIPGLVMDGIVDLGLVGENVTPPQLFFQWCRKSITGAIARYHSRSASGR